MGGVSKNNTIIVNVSSAPAATNARITYAPCSEEATILIGANADRKGLIIYNHCIYSLFVKFDSHVLPTLSSFTMIIPSGSTYEMSVPFAGEIGGIWDHNDPDGVAHITELY